MESLDTGKPFGSQHYRFEFKMIVGSFADKYMLLARQKEYLGTGHSFCKLHLSAVTSDDKYLFRAME